MMGRLAAGVIAIVAVDAEISTRRMSARYSGAS